MGRRRHSSTSWNAVPAEAAAFSVPHFNTLRFSTRMPRVPSSLVQRVSEGSFDRATPRLILLGLLQGPNASAFLPDRLSPSNEKSDT